MKKVFLLLLLICTLTAQAQTYWNGTADKNFPGEGTEASPYLISTPEQLAGLATRVNEDGEDFAGKFIQLANDIYLLSWPKARIPSTGSLLATRFGSGAKRQNMPISVARLMVQDIPSTIIIMDREPTSG